MTTTTYGWPMVPIQSGPYAGEKTPCCPKCFSTRVSLTVRYPAVGTGAGGRGRLGDPGSVSLAICRNCGNEKAY